jgi:uncharacterized protein (TIGR00297 family)
MEFTVAQFLLGMVLSAAMGGLGYWRRALSTSGVFGAFIIGSLVFGFGGWIWGLLLITFFVSSSWLSYYRRDDKVQVSEKFAKGSRRDLGQTLANGGVAAILAVVFARFPEPLLFAAFIGAMSTVNADTWATELGVLSTVLPRSMTTGQRVPPGTPGGVTRLGIWAAVAGALLIGTVATLLAQVQSLLAGGGWGLQAISYPLLAVVGGFSGSLFDSLLGATVQGVYFCDRCRKETESPVHRCGRPTRLLRGFTWLNNDVVNFLSSLVGAMLAASLAWLIWR